MCTTYTDFVSIACVCHLILVLYSFLNVSLSNGKSPKTIIIPKKE